MSTLASGESEVFLAGVVLFLSEDEGVLEDVEVEVDVEVEDKPEVREPEGLERDVELEPEVREVPELVVLVVSLSLS